MLINFLNFPVAGDWTKWTSFSDCSTTCGLDAVRTRTRNCANPSPLFGGKSCMTVNGSYALEETERQNCSFSCCKSKNFIIFIFGKILKCLRKTYILSY